MNTTTIKQLIELMPTHHLDCVAIIPGPTLYYLTGSNFHLSERPIVAFFPINGIPALVVPAFEASKLPSQIANVWRIFPWTDEEGVADVFKACCQTLNLSNQRLGVESLSLRFKEYQLLTTFAPQIQLTEADALISQLRIVKNKTEIAHIKAAVVLAETVLQQTLPLIKIGMTEKEVAAKLMMGLLEAGSDPLPFEPLVQTGPSGANPHGTPTDRQLAEGDLLIVDFGARVNGYVSDITRTFAVGELSDKAYQIYNLVKQANQAGREAAKPGVECQMIDRTTRQVIEKGGFGQYFTHRTGHGIGLEGHEPPFMVAGSTTLLKSGMVFTIEPGIYIPDLGGVRIEDDVVITKNDSKGLTTFNHELIII